MESFLQSFGYDVVTFESAEHFLSSGHARDTSCLLADIQLPGITGIELQKRLIADGYRFPVIFVSGVWDEDVRASAMKVGAIGVLDKPFNVASLVRLLRKALKESS
jgi:FixJ family two-component response regulator